MKVIIHNEYEVSGCHDCPYYQWVQDGNAQWLDCHHPESSQDSCPLGIDDPKGEKKQAQDIADDRKNIRQPYIKIKIIVT